jgi:hypothetical protein
MRLVRRATFAAFVAFLITTALGRQSAMPQGEAIRANST